MSFPPRYRSRGDVSGAESREKAVRAAMELFATSGFKGTSIARVAEKTGLSQSGLLHHFPSKTALLSAVLEARDAEDGEFLSAGGDAPLGWAAFDSLAALVARNSTRPQLVGLYVRVSAEAIEPGHPAHEWLRSHYANVEAWLTDAVQAGKERGEIRADAPVEALVRTTIAVLDGLQQQWLLRPESVSMTKLFNAHVQGLREQWSSAPEQPPR
ncbi:TetR/AcrR family transcriptional regulator [Amycolatopsis acidicola]|uniref:TetR/AcrR family transcriptional regulator n=1 Tax=Amycolatopsis acidicola TaxID=2596893 RepID=A0A5N0V4D9_9PSEU|nr:TetR/AcrR family transcriptional regulator [Amycolatopsis acidicola]KAA9159943.1 TetR/AcrR family transcriptional regulator [Amycolatopsis acidicola]